MTEPADLLDLHVAALFTQDEHGNLVATNDPEPDQVAAPRIYLGRSPERSVLRFRSGMDEATRAALRELAAPDLTANDPNREPVNRAAIEELLAAEQPIQNIYFGPAFSFPDSETLAASLNPGPSVIPAKSLPRTRYGAGIHARTSPVNPTERTSVRALSDLAWSPLPRWERARVRAISNLFRFPLPRWERARVRVIRDSATGHRPESRMPPIAGIHALPRPSK